MAMDEEAPRRRAVHEIGQDLSALSLDDLAGRIELLKSEIERIQRAIGAKTSSRAAADAVFKIS